MDLTLESAFSVGGAVGHLSYILLIASMMMTRISWLRVLVIASALVGISYDWFWLRDPVGVFWEGALVIVNVTQLALLYLKNSTSRFSNSDLAVVDCLFPGLERAQARRVLSAGEWVDLAVGTKVAVQGAEVEALIYVQVGEFTVSIDAVAVSTCGPGDLIGEMTMVTNGQATATCVASAPARVWRIQRADLMALSAKDEALARELQAAFARSVVSKLVENNLTWIKKTSSPAP